MLTFTNIILSHILCSNLSKTKVIQSSPLAQSKV
ncbi:Uncharacterised protein [Vibrio cholerae]|nr:Uncharacterised protein [Vibrio cholerae]